jgi:hypothetical protein
MEGKVLCNFQALICEQKLWDWRQTSMMETHFFIQVCPISAVVYDYEQ